MESMSGHIERITYQSAETGFTVARFFCVDRQASVSVVGVLTGVQTWMYLLLSGEWGTH